jgi:hypothetical protein
VGRRLAALWRQVPRRRRFAAALLAAAWWWAVGGDWWCDLIGGAWWLGWAAIVGSGMGLAVIQGRRLAAWWRRQVDLDARAAAIAAATRPHGRVYVSRRDWSP